MRKVLIRRSYLVHWSFLLRLWPDRSSRPERRKCDYRSRQHSSNKISSQSLSDQAQHRTEQTTGQNKAGYVRFIAVLHHHHHPVTQSLFRKHPGHKHRGSRCWGFGLNPLNAFPLLISRFPDLQTAMSDHWEMNGSNNNSIASY